MYGWGVLLSTVIHLNNKHSLFSQYSFGEGIANYYVGFGDRQLDAVYNPQSMDMTLKNIHGGFITYSYDINKLWRFSLTSGISYIKGKDFEPGETFWSSKYQAANIFYEPIETIDIGFEITAGTRTNQDRETGNATRISLRASFDF